MIKIHPTAIIEDDVKINESQKIKDETVEMYYNFSAKSGTVLAIITLFMLPIVMFLIGWFFHYESDLIWVLFGFGLFISSLTFVVMRKVFAKYFKKSPVFTIKNDGIETVTGKILYWHHFRDAILFTYDRTEYIGLRKKGDVNVFAVTDFQQSVDAQIFQLPFVVQLDLFTIGRDQIIERIERHLTLKKIESKFKRQLGINFNEL